MLEQMSPLHAVAKAINDVEDGKQVDLVALRDNAQLHDRSV
jgi:hypothetical protein